MSERIDSGLVVDAPEMAIARRLPTEKLVAYANREFVRIYLFNSFLRLRHDGGINEFEDPNQPFPKGGRCGTRGPR